MNARRFAPGPRFPQLGVDLRADIGDFRAARVEGTPRRDVLGIRRVAAQSGGVPPEARVADLREGCGERLRVGMDRCVEDLRRRPFLDDLDRAITDGAEHGFVKVLTAAGSDRIVGAMIVGAEAGELIAEFVLAMKHGLGLNKVLGTIHVYPTMMEANKYAAGAWRRAHVSPRALRFAERFFAWRRG